jgi:hypothetical protein
VYKCPRDENTIHYILINWRILYINLSRWEGDWLLLRHHFKIIKKCRTGGCLWPLFYERQHLVWLLMSAAIDHCVSLTNDNFLLFFNEWKLRNKCILPELLCQPLKVTRASTHVTANMTNGRQRIFQLIRLTSLHAVYRVLEKTTTRITHLVIRMWCAVYISNKFLSPANSVFPHKTVHCIYSVWDRDEKYIKA